MKGANQLLNSSFSILHFMFDNFTDLAKRAVDVAREAAGPARRTMCGIEHLLLGLATTTESGAAAILQDLGLDESRLRATLGVAADAVARPVSFSPSALRAIEYAKQAAARLGHERIDTMHLLIGILEEADEEAMRTVGLDAREARVRVAEVFGQQLPAARMHPDLREWIRERVQAEASQLHATIDDPLIDRAIEMAGSAAGAPDEAARRLVRRAIALRHGGAVLALEREMDRLTGSARWEALHRQAQALPGGVIVLTADDLSRAAREL
jgi:ATP-dependent Clp protease ATP-binding subunit ClpA